MNYQSLIAELNTVRSNQRPLNSFSSVADWMAHCAENAAKKAEILGKMESLNK